MKILRAFKTELDLSTRQKTAAFVRLARLFQQLGFDGFRQKGYKLSTKIQLITP
jgi:hypothetical protein